MACPVHGGSLAVPCACAPSVNARRVAELIARLQAPTLPNPPLRPINDDWRESPSARYTFGVQ